MVKIHLASVTVDQTDMSYSPFVGCVDAFGGVCILLFLGFFFTRFCMKGKKKKKKQCSTHNVGRNIEKAMNASLNMDIPPHGLKH